MTEWREFKIKDIGTVITGTTPSSKIPEYFGTDIPFVTPTDFKYYFKYCDRTDRFLSKIGADKYKNRLLPPQSVLVTCIGSDMGKVAISKEVVITNQQINSIIVSSEFSSDFVYYSLIAIYDTLRTYGQSGTAVPIVNKTDFENITLLIPPLPEQKAIAEVLSSLDDKIDLLTRQNKTLEDLGQAYFRKWFDDEKNVGRLGDYIQLFDNKRIPLSAMEREKKKDGKLYPYYGAATIMDYINDYIFDGEYILLGEDGTVETADGYPVLQYATGKFWCNNHAHILQAKPPYTNYSLWFCLRQCTISHIVSGAVQPKINQQNLNSLEIPAPPQNVFDKINEISGNIFSKILANSEQIYTLQKLRDTLLPKLISGEVRVKI